MAIERETDKVIGLYILHPNNVGRCRHIANASYAVRSGERGKCIGEILVLHSLAKARELGFKIMQFNAVVSTNAAALRLYKKLGFVQLGVIPGVFHERRKLRGYHPAITLSFKIGVTHPSIVYLRKDCRTSAKPLYSR